MKHVAIALIPLLVVSLLLTACPDTVGPDKSKSDNTPPVVTLTPESATVANGADYEFTVTTTDADGDVLTITWYLDGVIVDGELGFTCVFNQCPDDDTVYAVRVQVSDGTVTVSKYASLTVLAPVSPDPAGNVEPANNTPSGAVLLDLSTNTDTADGYISYAGDEDWFRIAAAAGELLQITITQPESEADPAVALYAPGALDDPIWEKYTLSEPALIVSEWQLAETPGEYYLRVTSANNQFDPTVAYMLTITVMGEPESSEREPGNNLYDGAIVLTSGVGDNSGYVSYQGDEDWFRIAAAAGELLRITITQPESEADPAVALFGPGALDDPIWEKYTLAEPASIISEWQLAETTGEYYLRVTSANNHSDPTVAYTLTVTVTPEPESSDREPDNDTNDGAILLTSGIVDDDGYISYEGDEDWFKIAAAAGELLQITVTQPESVADPALELFAPNALDDPIWEKYTLSEPASIISEWQLVETNGEYYLRVTSANNHSDPTVAYTVTITVKDGS